MDFIDLPLALIVLGTLVVAALVVFFGTRRKSRPHHHHPRSHVRKTAPVFYTAPIYHAPVKRHTPEVAAQLPADTLPAVTVDTMLWERLVASRPDTHSPITDEARDLAPWPYLSGMIQQPALEKLLEKQEPFTGLVISIGINDSDSGMWHSRGLMQSVGAYITSLLRNRDFSCRTAYDEFVVVCPGEQGAPSQRRLNQIAERLWEYQLRGKGGSSILFNWGGVQAQDQSLAAAIASATERMRETKRSGYSAQFALAHRQAV